MLYFAVVHHLLLFHHCPMSIYGKQEAVNTWYN